jgi:hypothetical protein
MPDEYIAQHQINAPGSYATGYMAGDPVDAQVVTDWGLAVPGDVRPSADYLPPRPAEDSDDRGAWEAYVIGQGMTLEEARAASLEDLREAYDAPEPEGPPAHDLPANAAAEGVDGVGWQNATPVTAENIPGGQPATAAPRPADSARKDDWVAYVLAAGADPEWANDPATTKDDLKAWQAGD